jgi:hypothetical protein
MTCSLDLQAPRLITTMIASTVPSDNDTLIVGNTYGEAMATAQQSINATKSASSGRLRAVEARILFTFRRHLTGYRENRRYPLRRGTFSCQHRKRETGLEPATLSLGSRDSTSTRTHHSWGFRVLLVRAVQQKVQQSLTTWFGNTTHCVEDRRGLQCLMRALGFVVGK